MATRPPWRRSLWVRVLMVTVAVAMMPLLFVTLSSVSDGRVGEAMTVNTQATAARAARLLVEHPDDAERLIDDLAMRRVVRVRVLDEDGVTRIDRDRELGRGLAYRLGGLFFGPDGAPTLADWDAGQEPPARRIEVAMAREVGQAAGCEESAERRLLVCHAALAVDTPAGPRVVYVQESSRRAIRALYDLRYQVLKLTLLGGLMALGLGGWLGWRVVRPVEQLREQVLTRATPPVSTRPVHLDRVDELGDLAAAFNALLEALEARSRATEGFVQDLAHELKNPVAAVRAAADALDGDAPLDPARARRLARVLRSSSQRLDEVVTRLLELARAEAGLSRDERLPLDLAALVRGVVEQLAAADGPVVTVEAPPRAALSGASTQLETAVRNLVDNARSFARERVTVRLASDPRGWRLEVCDDGPGIPPELRERVFDRFFTTREQRKGTGLGLAMSRAVFRAHGGRLTVEDPVDGVGARLVGVIPEAAEVDTSG